MNIFTVTYFVIEMKSLLLVVSNLILGSLNWDSPFLVYPILDRQKDYHIVLMFARLFICRDRGWRCHNYWLSDSDCRPNWSDSQFNPCVNLSVSATGRAWATTTIRRTIHGLCRYAILCNCSIDHSWCITWVTATLCQYTPNAAHWKDVACFSFARQHTKIYPLAAVGEEGR
jgi:hypothetical protein